MNESRRGASDWGRERAGRIAEGPRRRIAQRGGTYRSPEGVVWGEGALQEDVTVVLGGAKAPPSDVEGTRPPGAQRIFHSAEFLGRQLVRRSQSRVRRSQTTQKAWACRVSACACLAVVASVWTLRVVVITRTVHVVVHQCVLIRRASDWARRRAEGSAEAPQRRIAKRDGTYLIGG